MPTRPNSRKPNVKKERKKTGDKRSRQLSIESHLLPCWNLIKEESRCKKDSDVVKLLIET